MSYGHTVTLMPREDSRCGQLEICGWCLSLMHTCLVCIRPVHSTPPPLFTLQLVSAAIRALEDIKSAPKNDMLDTAYP